MSRLDTPGEPSSALLRRQLQATLRGLREARGLSEREVAATLGWQPQSKILQIERGLVDISTIDLCLLLRHYGVEEDDRVEELVQVASQVRRQRFDKFRDVLLPGLLYYLQYESAASVFRNFEPSFVPGLLQTEQYARTIFSLLDDAPPETIARRIQVRMERQKILSRKDSLKATFIIDEAVIHRMVGSRTAMIQQLSHIRKMSTQPNIELRVIPFLRGAHIGMAGNFTILEFPLPDYPDMVYVEHQAGAEPLDGRSTSGASYIGKFWQLEDCSASADESADMIDRTINRLADL
jgi:transcriptional regulator with XRE-family HTH domain